MELKTGFFVDWDGHTRRVEAPGDGLECQVLNKGSYVGVDVLASDGCVIHEATYFPTLAAVQAAGVEVHLV